MLCSSLDTDHGEIDAFLCQQLLVCAVLLDSAILKHHYQVCVLDGGQPVSDHDAGAALSGFVQGFLDHLLIKQNRSLTLKIIEISFKSKGNASPLSIKGTRLAKSCEVNNCLNKSKAEVKT